VIRAFIAVGIEPETVQKISEAVDRLKGRAPAIKWAPLANLHLTLKFLGDVEETAVEPIAKALRQYIGPFPRFTINAKGLGVFPGVKRPRILWVGLEGNQLIELASIVETALKPLGFPPEDRDFKPHLTIGRWRQPDDSAAQFGAELERWKGYEFGRSEVKKIVLFQSILRPEGAIHKVLAEITLSGERPLN